jgi:hypothetical protein
MTPEQAVLCQDVENPTDAEKVAIWMIKHGYSVMHGATIDEHLESLTAQLDYARKVRKAEVRQAIKDVFGILEL